VTQNAVHRGLAQRPNAGVPWRFAGREAISLWSRREADRQQANTAAHIVDMGRRGRARSHFDAVRTGIGTELRSLYSNVLNEPLPEKIAELLRQLDEQIRQLDRDDDI
jgi:Anti-sigma factor NepR